MTTTDTLRRFRHIAVEGPIGAGKTTLARLLASRLEARLVLEQPAENPFLGRFYDDMAGYAFQTQLFFLFQRQKQLQALAQPSVFAEMVVSDFMFAKNAIFAGLTLGDDEFRIYSQIQAPIAAQLPQPDLVIWLRASPTTLLERVRRRGQAIEAAIDRPYLASLTDAYDEFFASYDGAPVFVVDTEDFDPLARRGDVDALLQRLAAFHGRRGAYATQVDIAFE